MLIPHLHFNGNCVDVIKAYEKAFDTTVDAESIDYMADGKRIAHANMNIHGNALFLNDGLEFFSNSFGNTGCSGHLCVTFNTTDALLECYEALKTPDASFPFYETPYSKMVGNFLDKFGVLWGFMVTD